MQFALFRKNSFPNSRDTRQNNQIKLYRHLNNVSSTAGRQMNYKQGKKVETSCFSIFWVTESQSRRRRVSQTVKGVQFDNWQLGKTDINVDCISQLGKYKNTSI